MVDQESKKINIKNFLEDFVRGASDEELREKYGLKRPQLATLVSKLKQLGRITEAEMSRRAESLAVRFGDPAGPPRLEDEQGLPVDLDTGFVLHCPSCGAPVERNAGTCEYCDARLDFSLKGKTLNCPHCFARIDAESRFCMRCAKPVQGIRVAGTLLPDRLCPRCGTAMEARKIGDFSVTSCFRCFGFFVPSEVFEMMQDNSNRVIVSNTGLHREPLKPEAEIRYVRCPVCRKMMNRVNFARISGVIVDSCREHGIWFDPGELEKIMEFVATGGLQKARKAENERLKADEQIARIRESSSRGGEPSWSGSWGNVEGNQNDMALTEVVGWLRELFRRG